ncbi:hypothetical protein L5515_015716 [Caenorhabditis briggsae]|uniref:Uncharacterized protein n=1 Tax=Caenorhabditis briggsae TaxID=6238 RepID=A0AAE9ECG4_CAEBR|nr:hypothetical protein L5515_015716 [Caenorhabditis briggsae]
MLNKKRVRQRFRNRIAGELPNVRSEEEAKPILTIPSCSTVFNSSIDVNNQHSTNCKMPAKDDFAHPFELAPIKPRGEAFNFELSKDEIRSRNAGFRAVIVEKWMASLVEHRRVLVYTCSRTDGTSENAPWHERQTGERPRRSIATSSTNTGSMNIWILKNAFFSIFNKQFYGTFSKLKLAQNYHF